MAERCLLPLETGLDGGGVLRLRRRLRLRRAGDDRSDHGTRDAREDWANHQHLRPLRPFYSLRPAGPTAHGIAEATLLEPKDDMRRRGLASRDADALALIFAYPVFRTDPAEERCYEELVRVQPVRAMSAFPLEADTSPCPGDVGFVPLAAVNDSRPVSALASWACKNDCLYSRVDLGCRLYKSQVYSMRRLQILIVALAVSIAILSSTASADPADQTVSSIIEKWSAGFNKLDADALASLYSKNALFFGSTPPLYKGKEGVAA
ncbi:MAG: YybH family protein, partial [Reyranella sp.]